MRATTILLGLALVLPATAGAVGSHFVIDSWGRAGTGPGEFDWAADLDVDGQGNVYVVDKRNARIQKFNQEGRFILSWDGDGLFDRPAGIAVDPAGACWVTDWGRSVLEKFDLYGNRILSRPIPPPPGGSVVSATAVAVGPEGHVFVLDNNANGIHRYNSSGNGHVYWSVPGSTSATDLAVDSTGEVFVLDFFGRSVYRLSASGALRAVWPVTQANGTGLTVVSALDISDTDELYVLSRGVGDRSVYRYTRGGAFLSRSSLASADPVYAVALAVDWTGNLWVADRDAPAIIRLAPPAAATHILQSSSVPGYVFEVRIVQGPGRSIFGAKERACIPETLCVSGALPGRSEVFLRVVGPKPNGKMWPTLVKFSTSTIEIWMQQVSTGRLRYYRLPGAPLGVDELPGLFDRMGYDP